MEINKNNYKPLNLNKKFLSNTATKSPSTPTQPKLLTGKVNQQSTWKQLNELKHWDEIDEEDDLVLVDQAGHQLGHVVEHEQKQQQHQQYQPQLQPQLQRHPDQSDEMHSAAIRAKQRRQLEENERLEAQHRAQKKASELADRLAIEQQLTHQQTTLAKQRQLSRERERERSNHPSSPQPPPKSILTRNPNTPAYNPWTARIEARQQLQNQPASPPPWRKPKVKVPCSNPSKPQPITTKIPFYPPSSATNYKFDKIRVKLPKSAYSKTINTSDGTSYVNHKNQIDALDGLMDKIKSMMSPQQVEEEKVAQYSPKQPPAPTPAPDVPAVPAPAPPQSKENTQKEFNPPSKPRSMYINNQSRRHSNQLNLPSQREEFLKASTSAPPDPLHKSLSSQ
ncbi:hypothetical protein E3P77_02488 [Wallemia ichthyophaga]|nr:hypothetical protein E3P77_02488 [Wallemia ichthyophaga]